MSSQIEKSFVMLKPLGLVHGHLPIMDALRQLGTVELTRLLCPPRNIIVDHYVHQSSKEFFPRLIEYYSGKNVIAVVMQGENVIQKIRDAIGPKDPRDASTNHLRRLVLDRFPDGEKGWRNCEQITLGIDNFIHASDSLSEAMRELALWRSYLDQTK